MTDLPPPEPSYEALWLRAFLITVALETPIYAALLRWRRPPMRLAHAILLGVALQAVTHPALWFVAARWLSFHPYWAWLVVMEVGVVLIEGALVAVALGGRPTWPRALGFGLFAALCANLVTTLVGLALH